MILASKQSEISERSCLDLLYFFCFSMSKLNLFFIEFYVLPLNLRESSVHFLFPCFSFTRSKRSISSYSSQGPFFNSGFKKLPQCYLHNFELLKILFPNVFSTYNFFETYFQLISSPLIYSSSLITMALNN